MPPPPRATTTLSGSVERVTFHNPDNGFAVLRVKLRGRRAPETVIGHAPTVSAGEWIRAEGEWVRDAVHGLQFRAGSLTVTPPTTREGIQKYLASGMVHGIGPVFAKRLVQEFGEDVFDIIEKSPSRLLEVDGIGMVRSNRIISAWSEHKAIREVMLFLHSHGVGSANATRIFRTYGDQSITIMTEDPYRLARDIRGIGFKTADAIARRLGIEPTAMVRVRAGVKYALEEAQRDGHCGLPDMDLEALAVKLLEVPEDLVREAITAELAARTIVEDTIEDRDCVFLSVLHRAENLVSEALLRRRQGPPPWEEINVSSAIEWVGRKTDLELAPSQVEAVRAAVTSRATVITGGPGVGKTTIVNAVLRILDAKKVTIALCAPTGRAAKRLAQTTGRDARTIHRLLEIDPSNGTFRRNASNPLDCDLLVVDEMSMVDVTLAMSLLRALPPRAALLIVGDVDQLPSVGPGQVLRDIIDSNTMPVVRLTEVFRQAAESQIIVNAHRINAGKMPSFEKPTEDSDFYFVETESPEQAVRWTRQLVATRIPKRFGLDPVRDIQVLCPMNRGGAGALAVNLTLQQALNPAGENAIERYGWTFAPGDKVMQTENDYDRGVYNGDIGFIIHVDRDAGEASIEFDGRKVIYTFSDLDAVMPAYATTIHKSQGSEYPAVVIPMLTQHFVMLQRNLLYTAVTRARSLAVLVGQRRAVEIAVRDVSIRSSASRRRWTKLRELLEEGMAKTQSVLFDDPPPPVNQPRGESSERS